MTRPLNATPVDHLRTLPLRFDDVRRDPIDNVDLSLIKSLGLSNGMRLELRVEYINAFNEPYFPVPVVEPDDRDVRPDHGVQPGQLRETRAGRDQADVLRDSCSCRTGGV